MKHLAMLAAVLPLALLSTPAGAQEVLILSETDTWQPGSIHSDGGRYAMMVREPQTRTREVLVREETDRWRPGFLRDEDKYVRYYIERRPQVDSTDTKFK